jgi:hypothetical protein
MIRLGLSRLGQGRWVKIRALETAGIVTVAGALFGRNKNRDEDERR